MGVLFKNYTSFVTEIVTRLQTELLPAAFASTDQKRRKFGLLVLDDMVEHLEPKYFTQENFNTIV
jgi:hypothetical protein